MNIAVKKIELIEWLTQIQDKSLLKKVENLKKQATMLSYESKLKPMTSGEYKFMLDNAEEEYKEGRVSSQEDMEKESDNW